MTVKNCPNHCQLSNLWYKSCKVCHSREWFWSTVLCVMGPARFLCTTLLQKQIHSSWKVLKVSSVDRTYQNIPNEEFIVSDTKHLHHLPLLTRTFDLWRCQIAQNSASKPNYDISHARCVIAEGGFDPPTSALWAQHASSAPLCCCRNIFTALEKY